MARILSESRIRRLTARSAEDLGRWLDAIDRLRWGDRDLPREQAFRAGLLVSELCSNAWRHGGAKRTGLGVRVVAGPCVHVSFVDDGSPFDMGKGGALPDDLLSESGRGLFLIAELASRRRYRRWRGLNIHHFVLVPDPAWGQGGGLAQGSDASSR